MRQKYETSENLADEAEFVEFIRSKDLEITKLSAANYHIDFVIHSASKLMIMCEFKRRHCNHDKYPTYMVSLAKWMKLKSFAKAGITAGIYLMYDDGLFFIPSTAKYRVGMGKNGQMRDEYDYEPMVFIGINQMGKVDELQRKQDNEGL